jgi:Fe(3+) dicitrate transport protein
VGDIQSSGLELALQYYPPALQSEDLRNLYRFSLTYTHARLKGDANSLDEESIFAGGKDGARVPYVPVLQFSLGTRIETQKWELHLDGNFVGESYTTASNSSDQIDPNTGELNANYGKTDSRLIVDLSAKYYFAPQVNLFVNVHNLFDRTYLVSRHPIGPRPGRPFSMMVGIETRL